MENNIAEKITKLRKENNMTQEDLAEKVGVSRQAISKWERGETLPDVYNLNTLGKVFEISIDDLVNDEPITQGVKLVGTDIKKKSEMLIISSVMLYIMTPFVFLLLPTKNEVNIFIFGLLIACATGMIIYGSFLLKQYRTMNILNGVDEKVVGSINDDEEDSGDYFGSLVSISITIIYLILGFVFDLWHPGWIVFLLIPALGALRNIFRLRK